MFFLYPIKTLLLMAYRGLQRHRYLAVGISSTVTPEQGDREGAANLRPSLIPSAKLASSSWWVYCAAATAPEHKIYRTRGSR
jgi:hypothetical protein